MERWSGPCAVLELLHFQSNSYWSVVASHSTRIDTLLHIAEAFSVTLNWIQKGLHRGVCFAGKARRHLKLEVTSEEPRCDLQLEME